MLFQPKKFSAKCSTSLDQIPKDGFRLTFDSSESPKIESLTPAGGFYARALFKEMKRSDTVPEAGTVVEDWPDFEQRGFMLDISRNRVPTMAWLKELIDSLARLRYNEFQLYSEHTFAYRDHKIIWQDASPFKAADIREIDAYCLDRHIELVPNQNTFGHMERWIKFAPYSHLAECPNGFEHAHTGVMPHGLTLCPSPESVAFVDSLFEELLPNFSSGRVNVGGDEPIELGLGRSKDRVAAEGRQKVYLDYLNEIFALAKKHGRRPMAWADVILEDPSVVSQLSKDITPVIWGYEADFPFAEQCPIFQEAGFSGNFYVAPGVGTWFSFGGRMDVARSNIALAAQEGKRNGANGLLLTAWGDEGYHQPWPALLPGLVMGAQATWGGEQVGDNLPVHIDTNFYQGSGAKHGQAICDLGEIDGMLPQPRLFESFLHAAFFCDEARLVSLLELTDSRALLQCVEALQRIETEGLDPEINLGIELNLFALNRCLKALSVDNPSTRARLGIPELKKRFQELWLVRCEVGGLSDSLVRMNAARD